MLLVVFPDLETTVNKASGQSNDYVSAHLIMYGANNGSYPQVLEPTGRCTDSGSIVLFRMEDGKVAELWAHPTGWVCATNWVYSQASGRRYVLPHRDCHCAYHPTI